MSSSVNSRDGLYTGQDPGGGVRDAGAGEIPQHIPIPPPDKAPQKSVRKGHQRQYSDPSAVSQIESGTGEFDINNHFYYPLIPSQTTNV